METRYIDLEGQRLRVGLRRASRAQPPLLVFNGIGANLELVEPLVRELGDVEVVTFDVPGVGGSPAPVLPYRLATLALLADKLMRRLDYDIPVDVLGISWGGALAQQFARLFPTRCRRLILASTSPGAIMVPGRLSVLSKLIVPKRYADPKYLEEIGGRIYGGTFRRNPRSLREHGRYMRSQRGRGYYYQLLAVWGWTSLAWLGSLRQRTLVMHGDDDPIVPLINARILAARIPNSKLHIIDDGHLFPIARARDVAAVVQSFLAPDSPP